MSLPLLFVSLLAAPARAAEQPPHYEPTRYGLMLSRSYTYVMTEDITFYRFSAFASFDYDKVWRHWAPENLRWKLEFSTGFTTEPFERNVTSLVMIAQYYLLDHGWTRHKIRPYLEGGIGGVYTDFQIAHQGSRFMFNPQFGLGSDFSLGQQDFFLSVRHDHFSNGGFNSENRGVNSLSVFLGYYF